MTKRKAKRVVVISDLHCGHMAGLTPKPWQFKNTDKAHAHYKKRNKLVAIQGELWNRYVATMKSLQPIDLLIVNGDAIDGDGKRSGGTELITTDRNEQAAMAVECIKGAHAKRIVMTYGTGYHTGNCEDFETQIAEEVGAKIGSHEWIDVNDLIFDCRHHIGSSTIPHGRHTAVAKERMWNYIWSEHQEQPKGDIIIRSHVHYFSYCGGDNWIGITTPALQGMGAKYGSRRCSGHVDWGMISFDVEDKESWVMSKHLSRLVSQQVIPVKI